MRTLEALRRILLSSRPGIVLWNLAANQLNRFRLRAGSRVRLYPAAAGEEAAREKAGYLRHVWGEYNRWFPERGIQLGGARVLELGPGDTLGIPLLALAAGAAECHGLDKFSPERDPAFEARVYAALRDGLEPDARARLDAALTLRADGYALDSSRCREITDCALEDAAERLPPGSFDLVLSRSVLEYLKRPRRAAAALRHLLRPGGWMVHKVDARDDGLFTHHGHPPLAFLEPADAVYAAMTSHTYRPNRLRLSQHVRLLEDEGFSVEAFICRVAGQARELPGPVVRLVEGRDLGEPERALVAAARPRLARALAGLSDQDLLAAGFHLVAQKRA